MNILSLEASGSDIGIAALQVGQGVPQSEASFEPRAVLGSREPRQLSRGIITGLQSALQRADWQLDDVQAVAVGTGPGSWTSLRIALSTCKTLAQARDVPLAGVPTFDAMAAVALRSAHNGTHSFGADGTVASFSNGSTPQLPADFVLLTTARCRPGEIYGKIFRCRRGESDGARPLVLQPEFAAAPALAAQQISDAVPDAQAYILIGDGSEGVSAALSARGVAHLVLGLTIETLAVEVARLGAQAIARGQADSALELQPIYVMPSAAERNLRRD
jgi:tRNA threonylcarbamoyl adenosine modification protein YeaZ